MDGDDLLHELRGIIVAHRAGSIRFRTEFGLNTTDSIAVIALMDADLGMSELARMINLSSAAVTTLVDRLVEAGLVTRRRVRDRRRTLVALTPAFRERAEACYKTALRPLSARFDDLEPGQRQWALAFLRSVREGLLGVSAAAHGDVPG